MNGWCWTVAGWCVWLGLLSGCAQTTAPVPEEVKVSVPPAPPTTVPFAQHNASIIELATDPCAGQLQDIGGALAIYYHDYGGMPARLEMLAPVAKEWGLKFALRCPVSKQPYIYVAAGLGAPGQSRRLVLYDPTPAHEGWRWGVVMGPPPQGMTTVTPEVVRLSEDVLRVYLSTSNARGAGQ